jgi:hypothetical protein
VGCSLRSLGLGVPQVLPCWGEASVPSDAFLVSQHVQKRASRRAQRTDSYTLGLSCRGGSSSFGSSAASLATSVRHLICCIRGGTRIRGF